MNQEQVIELAMLAGFQKFLKPASRPEMICDPATIQRFATLVRNAALEEAKSLITNLDIMIVNLQPHEAVTAIEALKENPTI